VGVFARAAAGRARVVREIRASAPLMATLRAPVPARGPWLTAVLNGRSWSPAGAPLGCRPVAVVVEDERGGRPVAAAFLVLRRGVRRTTVTLLGQRSPVQPDGRPPARLLARDDAAAELLAAGIVDLLGSLGGAWALELHGLPLGDPTLRCLAAALPGSAPATVRSRRLVDELDALAEPPLRSRDPRVIERWLAELLPRHPDPAARRLLRATTRLHAAIDQLEVAVVADGGRPRAALLTLVDGADRWPWWGFTDVGGLRTEMGAPMVTFTARGGRRHTFSARLPVPPVRRSPMRAHRLSPSAPR
jgi:hypothetical protein